MSALVTALLGLTLSTASVPAPASVRWGFPGHRVIAELAWQQLRPATRDRLTPLLDGATLAAVSTWADSIRSFRRETAPWHYVNIPIWAPRYEPDRYCPDGDCVLGAIARFRPVLADTARPPAERAEALRFLVHFVGDMHQPLHVGDRGDRGGNDVMVRVETRDRNLHAVWDTDVVSFLAPSEGALLLRLQARLADVPPDSLTAWRIDDVLAWAMEGHRAARESVYRIPRDGRLDDRYFVANAGLVETALLKAAVRLAMVLERAVGDP